jgi:hypothetical protein
MNAIKMKRLELLTIVLANKEKHVAEYQESVEDYKKLVLQITTNNLKAAKTGDLVQFQKIKAMPPQPVTYEDSYKRAIRMLELSVEDIIEVEEEVFNQLVLDEWQWKRNFMANSTIYKSGF